MCEQTEINYLDGDVVWVKLGACWWPGQVTGIENLPDDVKAQVQRKSLIAVVKFFQEDTFEYVKNYQQIYKYNCTLKEEFIRKGLDKYRTKSKDGATYMDKFPADIETAEKLTGGDPDILNDERFIPEEKPDISSLFGEKKIPKKKRDRDMSGRKSDGAQYERKITHPRFLRESDHEVRIRQQPGSLSSSSGGEYSCHSCSFTSSRVNVIICHSKSHTSGETPPPRLKLKTYSPTKSRVSESDTPKRKYVRKTKSLGSALRKETSTESMKRKYQKQNESSSKKKKTDPELREKLLADWDDGSDDDVNMTQAKPDINDIIGLPTSDSVENNRNNESLDKSKDSEDNNDILAKAEEFLKDTDTLISNINESNYKDGTSPAKEKQSETKMSDSKTSKENSEKDDKKSRLSCFDFDEDDVPEPSIPPVRKIPRVFGEKNLSLKKEMIKEFEMSQALKTEQEKEMERIDNIEQIIGVRSSDMTVKNLKSKEKSEDGARISNDRKKNSQVSSETKDNDKGIVTETELEIVEIFEVEREEGDDEAKVEQKSKKNASKSERDSEKKLKDADDTLSEHFTTETEDETVSESADTVPEQSEASDAESSQAKIVVPKRRRGRPRKNPLIKDNASPSVIKEPKSSKMLQLMETERKTSESDTERSYTGRKRKPNMKYMHSDIYVQDVDQKSLKTDDSLSESEDKVLEKPKSKRGRKPGYRKQPDLVIENKDFELELSEQMLDNAESNIDQKAKSSDHEISKGKKFTGLEEKLIQSPRPQDDDKSTIKKSDGTISGNKNTTNLENNDNENKKENSTNKITMGEDTKIVESLQASNEIEQRKTVDMLPPKKSQIKKFELSQIDFMENESADAKLGSESPTKKDDAHKETISEKVSEDAPANKQDNYGNKDIKDDLEVNKNDIEDTVNEQMFTSPKSSMQTRYKGKFTPETGAKVRKETPLDDDFTGIFQDSFTKSSSTKDGSQSPVKLKRGRSKRKTDDESTSQGSQTDEDDSQTAGNSNKQQIKLDESLNVETVKVAIESGIAKDAEMVMETSKGETTGATGSGTKSEVSVKSVESDSMQKLDSSKQAISGQSVDVTVPVKKREMPRIIENVTLTEPVQIFKTKLTDNLPLKGVKHKMTDQDSSKKGSKMKIMKVEGVSSNSKIRAGSKITPSMSITKKLQVLKAEEAESASQEIQKEKSTQANKTITISQVSQEKFIQQSSQSLADMELDINSMPFVLSEDVLTPENMEQMPVVLSSILPSSSTMPSTMTLTPTTQIVTSNQAQYKVTSDNTGELTPTKRKCGTPAILKSKTKAKPTITSIKTIVPPLTGGVKGLKFQSAQPAKTQQILTQKTVPGKYVVVQAAAGQQLRYSVQGKTPTTPKKLVTTGKTAGNAQVVQHGSKVVILTSAQSGQTKMLPLNISKSIGGKVQRIVTSKGQMLCPINPQNIIQSKTVIAPKTDVTSATTSKLPTGHKIINQGIITSKAVLTPIGSSLGKSALLGTIPQGIITKSGIYTPISASSLSGKTIIGSKTIVAKGGTLLSAQNIGTSKTILAPITQTVGGKATIIGSQNIVASKGTVLTPITGQQVKAIAAKSPSKGGKVQYQTVQQKVQLPALQKSSKIVVSSTTKSAGSQKTTLVYQNAAVSSKNIQLSGKKVIKQTILQPSSTMQSVQQGTIQQITTQKGKMVNTPVQKMMVQRVRSKGQQQKIIVQQEPMSSVQVQNVQGRQIRTTVASPVSKTVVHQKIASMPMKSTKTQIVGKSGLQKSTTATNLLSGMSSSNVNIPTQLGTSQMENVEVGKTSIVSPVVDDSTHKLAKLNTSASLERSSEIEKVEEAPKVSQQPQIMALPTESTDGTQTYVLVTIDEQGQIQPLDNNALMSLEGTTQNPDGTRTLYIDPSSLGEAGTLDNIVLQFDNSAISNVQASSSNSNSSLAGTAETTSTIVTESYPPTEIIQSSNQDILAAALANTDFQQEISLPENTSVMTTGLTQTSLINQTILQSTIIPPTEPISSPSVLETSLTLNQPIMTPLEVPSSLSIQSDTTPSTVVSTIPSSLELPITITNPNLSFITTSDGQIHIPGNSMPDIGEIMESTSTSEIQSTMPASSQYLVLPNLDDSISAEAQAIQTGTLPVSYSVSIPNNIVLEASQTQTTPSMPIIDDGFTEDVQYATTASITTESSFVDVPVSEMLVSKASVVTNEPSGTQDSLSSSEVQATVTEIVASTQESSALAKEILTAKEENVPEASQVDSEDQTDKPSSMPIIDEAPLVTESNLRVPDESSLAEPTVELSKLGLNRDENMKVEESTNEISQDTVQASLDEPMDISEPCETPADSGFYQAKNDEDEPTSQDVHMEEVSAETSQEPTQSFDQFDSSLTESVDLPSQSANKSNSGEPSQSTTYEPMEVDEEAANVEPPTQSFEDSKTSEATQSYNQPNDENINAPTQSFNEILQSQDDRTNDEDQVDDPSFPTQSYEVGKLDNLTENLETDGELSQEGNIPSQSNDIGTDGIGTSSVSTNNSGLNEDETASSSYVPETPENQERDQDQESAISTSSYEIPPCEELNIASSSVIPDTSVRSEHTSIHDNGVPEIPTSSYNLNPDISSTHVDSVPTSSYEDQVIVEQNVSTSYDAHISMPGLDENSSQNFVTESGDQRNEPSSYYAHQEVSASYYEPVNQDDNSRLTEDTQEEVTPSYYEGSGTHEASQSYFAPEEAEPSYTRHNDSSDYYGPPPESEASQSYYPADDIEKTEDQSSSSQNIEASQSFYQERGDELRLGQRAGGEATPTYNTERYPVDYPLDSSSIERHDLVESSVPATKPAER